jgi:7-keto-8-aminopelargonate synthetase-like enzyme
MALPFGAGSARLIAGWSPDDARLADEVAMWKGTRSAILFPSGYQANVGAIAGLVDEGDAIFAHRDNHASLIDGCRLSRAARHLYTDAAELEALLSTHRPRVSAALVVTDTLFSMSGAEADLVAVATLAKRFNARLYLDEAHAGGLYGPHGAGLAAACNVAGEDVIHMGTFSKAVGSAGGFVAADRATIDRLLHTARSFVFTTGVPPLVTRETLRRVRAVRGPAGQAARERLFATVIPAVAKISGLSHARGPIVPIPIGSEEHAVRVAGQLWDLGVHVPAIRYPTVARGAAMLRLSLSAAHTTQQITHLANALRSVGLTS